MSDLLQWLRDRSLEKHHDALSSNGVDFALLVELTEDDLKELGFSLGDRKRFLIGQRDLKEAQPGDAPQEPAPVVERGALQERRQLTLMFVDLVGSTALSNRLDLEAYRETLHLYQTCCLEAIRDRNGFVAQFLGDGIVAYFGYPVAHEAAAEAAVLAGMRICEKIQDVVSPAGEVLKVRIGIATGDVLIDKLTDANEISAGLALGDTPNLAARLQGAAEPGMVAISTSTKALLSNSFTLNSLGERAFKGFTDPMEVWIVKDFQAPSLRFKSRRGDAASPLINREDEMRTLASRWRATRRSEGQVVCISGEAGIGKSRLVDAAVEKIEEEDAHVIGLQCSPYRDASALFPVISLINTSAGILRTDASDVKLSKLEGLLREWAPGKEDALQVLTGLIGLENDDPMPPEPVIGEKAKERLQTVLIEIVLGLSENRPLLFLFEDLHWIDPSSEELLEKLIARLTTARVMLICTYRSGYDCRWEGMARVSSMPITRLDEKQSHEMVSGLLEDGASDLPKQLRDQIIARTDGVPLFVEEMVRMVRQRFAASPTGEGGAEMLSLPATLKDLLRAQIDGLPSASEVVPVCAAIGRIIHPPLLTAVSGHDAQSVRLLLDQLVAAKMLVRHGGEMERSYSFRHALILDVAYESMLPSTARALHKRIATALTGTFTDLAEASPEMLAHHYEKADMALEARGAWRDAAVLASSRWATKEALSHLRAALDSNARVTGAADDTVEIELRKMMVVALHRRGFASPAHTENFTRLSELLQKTGGDYDATLPFVTIHNQFGALLMRGEAEGALAMCSDISAVAETSGDALLELLAAHDQGMAAFFSGDFELGRRAFSNALKVGENVTPEEIFRLYPGDLRLVDGSMLLWTRSLQNAADKAMRRDLDQFVESLGREGHLFSRCYALAVSATAYQGLGDTDRTLAIATEAREISRETEFDYWSAWCQFLIGWARAMQGETAAGVAEIRAGVDAYLESGSAQMQLFAETLLADVYCNAGEIAEGLRVIEMVRQNEKDVTVRFQKSFTDRVEAALKAAS